MACVPGFPGAPGRDGRDGAKGTLGSPGKTGAQGPPGAEGKKGAKGEPGIQGPAGQKGQRGDKGESGTPRLSSHMNWKECTWKKVDGRDSGEIYVSGLSIDPSMINKVFLVTPLLPLLTLLIPQSLTFVSLSGFLADNNSFNSRLIFIQNHFLTAL